ncbi:MAG: hypothetical protein RIC85_06220 [Gammaproteobacteria bacterium]
MHKREDAFSCMDDCCGNSVHCQWVCPRNPKHFVDHLREINGFDLANIPRAAVLPRARLPGYAPYVYHGNRRAGPLAADAVAIPLHKLYRRRDGDLRYRDRAEITAAFGVSADAKLIVIGSGRDTPIEAWWRLSSRRRGLAAELATLGLDLATSLNYSLFIDQTRYEDLYNIKRIGVAWQEIVDAGQPCALHLNARTVRDYERLADFVGVRDEVTDVSFEFGTGAGWTARRPFHERQLGLLAQRVGRPLRIVMIGGAPAVPAIAAAYPDVVYIDTTAFMKAVNRQQIVESNNLKLKAVAVLTLVNQPIDNVLHSNVEVMKRRFARILKESRTIHSATGKPPTSEIPDSRASAQVERS